MRSISFLHHGSNNTAFYRSQKRLLTDLHSLDVGVCTIMALLLPLTRDLLQRSVPAILSYYVLDALPLQPLTPVSQGL